MACALQRGGFLRPDDLPDILAQIQDRDCRGLETSRMPTGTTGVTSRAAPTKDQLMVELRVQSLGLDQVSKTPVVILQEVEGERMLPIWIGAGEASAIAMELSGMKFSRP